MATTKDMWLEYVGFLEKNVPASFANLAPGATDSAIAQLETTLGVTFPESVKTVWRLNDGQKETMLADDTVVTTPCIPTLSFLSTKKVESICKMWEQLRDGMSEKQLLELDSFQSSAVPGVIEPRYSSAKWIPLWADPSNADYVGLDFAPGEKGKSGQIINFGRNENTLFQFAYDFDDLLACLLEEIRSGKWKATVFEDANEKEIPWFGPPRKNFFNTLHARWETRNKKPEPEPKKEPAPATAPTPRGLVRALEDKSAALARNGEIEAAYQTILEAEAILPKLIPVLRAIIDLAIKLGRFAEADIRFATLLEVADKDLSNRDVYFYQRIDNLIDGVRNRALAIEVVEARLARFPEDEDLIEKLAELKRGA